MPLIRQKRKGDIRKSGAISLQPKNQLNEIDNLQGTIPLDLSINGHELVNTNIKFDDSSKNYIFGQNYTIGNISEGLPSNDNFYGDIVSTPNTIGTTFSKNCHISKKFIKDERQKERLSIDFNPYKEENQIAIDDASEFYVSGTSPLVSANFQQSLLSRERIEIDFSNSTYLTNPVSDVRTFEFNSTKYFAFNTFSYYSFISKGWIPFNGFPSADGSSNRNYPIIFPPRYTVTQLEAEPERFAIPFSPSAWSRPDKTAPVQLIKGPISEPISNFGFPFAKKYDPYDQNLLKMSKYIDKPFLLEKIIIKCKKSNYIKIERNIGAYQVFPSPVTVTTNIFILNQRNVKSNRVLNKFNSSTIESLNEENTSFNLTGDINRNNLRELVTYAKIVSTTTGSVFYEGDIYGTANTYNLDKIKSESDFYSYIDVTEDVSNSSEATIEIDEDDTEVQIEVPVRQSIKNNFMSHLQTWSDSNLFYVGNSLGGRSLLGSDFNKSFVNNSDNYSSLKDQYESVYNNDVLLEETSVSNRQVPYILYPDDNLIIGASTFSNFFFDNYFRFSSYLSDAKLILVGTPINDDKPKFEFDKRFLTSKNLRSGIVGDKFNTDRFDTLPIQFYASSSIDKIVESTGNEKIDRAVSGYYSGGNRGTLLKAVEMQNNDISLTGSLLSEKMHFNYNSYGNYSDIYEQRPYTSYFKLGDNIVYYPVEKKFYSTSDGEPLSRDNTESFNNSLESRIESPYKEE